MPKAKYTTELLVSTLERDNATSSKTYEQLNRETKIEFICICGRQMIKTFRRIVETGGAYCESCVKNNTLSKIKETNKTKYGVENQFQREEIKKQIVSTLETKYGVSHPSMIDDSKNKRNMTNLKKYGNICSLHGKEQKALTIITYLKKYGTNHPLQNKDIIKKVNDSKIKKYGSVNGLTNPQVKDKLIQTNLQKYGVKCIFESEYFKLKIRNTMKKKYGVEYPGQSLQLNEKRKNTCLQRYGVEYPQQSVSIHTKTKKLSKSYKPYRMPSGKIRKVQGYEPFALKILLEIYTEDEIETDRFNIPRITYIHNEKQKYYFPDIYIPKDNKIIEVKSNYTFELEREKNLEKQNYTRNEGYQYEIWIFNQKKELTVLK